MAKGLAQKMFPKEFFFDSAGIDAETAGGANFRAICAIGEYGVDLMSHRAKSVTDVAVSEFDHIIAMDSTVYDSVVGKYPDVEDRTIQWDIEDPFYGTIESYRKCAEEIYHNLVVLADRIGLSRLDG